MRKGRGPEAVKASLIGLAVLLLLTVSSGFIGLAANNASAQATTPAAPAGTKAKKEKAKGAQPQVPPGEYVGSDTCTGCHTDIHADQLPYHKAISTNKRLNFEGRTCEACHGPGKAHAESADPTLIFSFKRENAQQVMQKCMNCHAQATRAIQHAFDAHSRNSVSCVACHSIHSAKQAARLLAGKPEQFCTTCHVNVKAEFNRPYRHRLTEGMIGCLDCHNPHGSPKASDYSKAQLRRTGANEVACLKCHANLRGPFTFEHLPVRTEGCQFCHEAHGSVNPRMLTRSEVRFLCLECHTTNTRALGSSPPAFHDIRSPRFQNCTTCHNKIHGSYVDAFFER